jgi:hypothetical protein
MCLLKWVQNFFFGVVVIMTTAKLAVGQVIIRGTVYDHSEGKPLPGVSVLAVSGAGTSTDSLGHYSIRLAFGDSLYCSWLGKVTVKYAVKDIPPEQPFNLTVEEISVRSLPVFSVFSADRNYYEDSINNRQHYGKSFDYESRGAADGFKMSQRGGFGVGLDLKSLLSPGDDNRALALQQRLEENEKDKYIDHRFNKALVKKITHLESPALDLFMELYRPSYDALHQFETEYDYYQWISNKAKNFTENRNLELVCMLIPLTDLLY